MAAKSNDIAESDSIICFTLNVVIRWFYPVYVYVLHCTFIKIILIVRFIWCNRFSIFVYLMSLLLRRAIRTHELKWFTNNQFGQIKSDRDGVSPTEANCMFTMFVYNSFMKPNNNNSNNECNKVTMSSYPNGVMCVHSCRDRRHINSK